MIYNKDLSAIADLWPRSKLYQKYVQEGFNLTC